MRGEAHAAEGAGAERDPHLELGAVERPCELVRVLDDRRRRRVRGGHGCGVCGAVGLLLPWPAEVEWRASGGVLPSETPAALPLASFLGYARVRAGIEAEGAADQIARDLSQLCGGYIAATTRYFCPAPSSPSSRTHALASPRPE
ncbi:hypothetical protein ON010_g16369 [Phytophthora cinnamomi]|nr:hypothetical protein ON010_g16369 [Phytophthora cinnamomi]